MRDRKSGHNQGSALIITLLLITVLTGLVVDFVYEVYIDTSTLSNWSNAQRASFIAKSGQNLCREFISEVTKESYTDQRQVEFPVPQDLGPGSFLTVKIEDENSKFNINTIIYPNGLTNEEAFASLQKLFEYLNINPNFALSIADWIDADSEPRLIDSEDDAKNDYLWSLDELLLIEGIDDNIFSKISRHITVHGNGLVNVNTAELPVLVSLHPDMTVSLVQSIIEQRESFPFESTVSVQNMSGMEVIGQRILGKITVKSTQFRVTSLASVNDIKRIIESSMDTSKKVHFWREG